MSESVRQEAERINQEVKKLFRHGMECAHPDGNSYMTGVYCSQCIKDSLTHLAAQVRRETWETAIAIATGPLEKRTTIGNEISRSVADEIAKELRRRAHQEQ